MASRRIIHSWALATALLALGCGRGTTQGLGPDSAGDAAEPGAQTGQAEALTGPSTPWPEMSFAEKEGYMMQRVLPVMTAKFQEFDPGHFEGFGCQTCHGDNAREIDFAMPNPDLPPLYPTGSPEQVEMVEQKEEWAIFMFNHVTKPMATLLGIPEYTEESGEGFTCYYCHPAGESGTHGRSPLARQRQLPGAGGEAASAAGDVTDERN